MRSLQITLIITFLVSSFSLQANELPKKDINAILKYAKKFKGTPYQFGGTTPSAFDCSGFVRYVFNHFGYELTQASYNLPDNGYKLPVSDLSAGDLIFFRKSSSYQSPIGHVGIVVKNDNDGVHFIHASTSRGVIVSSLNEESYFKLRAEGGVRLW
ncbi:NlpC/P60 family protein [Spirosomataceae bacterium TFI 002]|nr:NlpC/P60 family protein [Spirosomataceae bacterium TFI 002]